MKLLNEIVMGFKYRNSVININSLRAAFTHATPKYIRQYVRTCKHGKYYVYTDC